MQEMSQAEVSSSVVGDVDDQTRGGLREGNESVDHRLFSRIEGARPEGTYLNQGDERER